MNAHPLRRSITFLIDFLVWLLLAALAVVVLDSLFPTVSHFMINAMAYTAMAILFVGYYFICEYYFQKTLGKAITGTKVTDRSGNKPSAKMVIVRSLIRLTPLDYLSYLITRVT
ncbi:RDD family protein [Litoribacter populi]|uniref:RDD family protein n=1 Tax=Litoribacter populi TaxID=2598460 RepID=UPI00117F0628|nr:RDD family protein [Litoribacter populi]